MSQSNELCMKIWSTEKPKVRSSYDSVIKQYFKNRLSLSIQNSNLYNLLMGWQTFADLNVFVYSKTAAQEVALDLSSNSILWGCQFAESTVTNDIKYYCGDRRTHNDCNRREINRPQYWNKTNRNGSSRYFHYDICSSNNEFKEHDKQQRLHSCKNKHYITTNLWTKHFKKGHIVGLFSGDACHLNGIKILGFLT